MIKLIRAALLLALFAAPTALRAQSAAPGSIVAFSSLPWGTSEAAILKQFGEPAQTAETGGLRVLAYADRVLDEDVGTWFYIHPQHGLVAGAYTAAYTYGNSCWEMYSKFKSAVAERYPSIRPQVTERTERTLPICTAITLRRGSAQSVWTDRVNGAYASVEVHEGEGPNERYIKTMYVSALGSELMDQASSAERRSRF
jgi:hypothetical protein